MRAMPVIERTADEVLDLTADQAVEVVNQRFYDLPGLMQHYFLCAKGPIERT